jgi:hypothetical protein
MNLEYTKDLGRAFLSQMLPAMIKGNHFDDADFWHSVTLKDGTILDVNYVNEEEPPYIVFYALDLNEHEDNSYNVFTRQVPLDEILTTEWKED